MNYARFPFFLFLITFSILIWSYFKYDLKQNNGTEKLNPDVSNANTDNFSQRIIWAGISGQSPKYIDEGPNIGMGWAEYQTHEIRKMLLEKGFDLEMDYMTHVRMDYEFQNNRPICFYPVEWKNSQELFVQKPDKIYSIPIDLAGESNSSIIIHKSDYEKFKRHTDEKGDILIDQLIEDKTLKTILERDVDYGLINKKVFDLSKDGEQLVKKKYRHNISLILAKKNQQLAEMLYARRFDYIFADSIEDQSFSVAGIDKSKFINLNYNSSTIKDINDPALVKISIACSIHPLTIKAMPFINQKIKSIRSKSWVNRMAQYRQKIDEKLKEYNHTTSLVTRFESALVDGTIDMWYSLQQKYFKDLLLYPLEAENERIKEVESIHRPVSWHAYQGKDSEWLILSDTEISIIRNKNNIQDKVLFQEIKESEWHINATDVFFNKLISKIKGPVKKLIVFTGGLSWEEISPLGTTLGSNTLERASIFDMRMDVAPKIISILPSSLKYLNLKNSSLTYSSIHQMIKSMPLEELHLNNTQITPENLGLLIKNLPVSIRALSAGKLFVAWTLANAKLFSTKLLPNLKYLDLNSSFILNNTLREIVRAIPESIEYIDLRTEPLLSADGLKVLLSKPLLNLKNLNLSEHYFLEEKKGKFNILPKLENLRLDLSRLSLAQIKKIQIPENLKDLDLSSEQINHEPSVINDEKITALFSKFNSKLESLNLSTINISEKTLALINKMDKFSSLKKLYLSKNNLNYKSMQTLDLGKLDLEVLDLSNNIIDNQAAIELAKKMPKNLKSLNLGFNPIGERGITAISRVLPNTLEKLYLSSVSSLAMDKLANALPRTLQTLDISLNQVSNREIQVLALHLPQGLLELNLNNSNFTSLGTSYLAQKLPPFLEKLYISNTPIDGYGLVALSKRMPPTLSKLSLGGFSANANEIKIFAQLIPSRLSELSIASIKSNDKGMKYLFQALPKTIDSFSIYNMVIDRTSGQAFSKSIPPNLRYFRFVGNKIDHESIVTITKNIPESLYDLWYGGTNIEDEGFISFFEKNRINLAYMVFLNDHFSPLALKTLSSKKRYIRDLAIVGSQLNDQAIFSLNSNVLDSVAFFAIGNDPITAKALNHVLDKINPEVAQIYCTSIKMQANDVDGILKVMPQNIRSLILSGNQIGQRGFEKIRKWVEERSIKTGRNVQLFE